MFDKSRKFIVDEMLGNLCRWLRMLGYDTTFAKDYETKKIKHVSDTFLIQVGLNEKRTMISRDKNLIVRYKSNFRQFFKPSNSNDSIIPCLFMKTQVLMEQLKDIQQNFNINLTYNINHSRCPKCNYKIDLILDTQNYQKLIPENVFMYHNEFWKCTNDKCGKIYWKGTHVDDINFKLDNLKKELKMD